MIILLPHCVRTRAQIMAKATGRKGSYVLIKLPHHNRLTQVYPDAMHMVKDVAEHVFNILTGKEDSSQVRKADIELTRFSIQQSTPHITKNTTLPPAPFRLSSEDLKCANSRVCSVFLPSPDFTPCPIFTSSSGLKSHDWKEVV